MRASEIVDRFDELLTDGFTNEAYNLIRSEVHSEHMLMIGNALLGCRDPEAWEFGRSIQWTTVNVPEPDPFSFKQKVKAVMLYLEHSR